MIYNYRYKNRIPLIMHPGIVVSARKTWWCCKIYLAA